MLILFKDFTGEKFELKYAPFNAGHAMTFVLVILAVILIIIIIICICVCRCICKKNKAVPYQDEQGQKTFNLQTMPEDSCSVFFWGMGVSPKKLEGIPQKKNGGVPLKILL